MCARLASYGTASPIQEIGYGDFLEIAKELAHRDILFLAISIRRLSELTSTQKLLKTLHMPNKPEIDWKTKASQSVKLKDGIDCWALFGKIIHSHDFFIIKDTVTLKVFSRKKGVGAGNSQVDLLQNKDIRAICAVKSDRGPIVLFSIADLVERSVDYLDEIKDIFMEKNVLPPWTT